MKKSMLLFLSLLLLGTIVKAQNYDHSVGARISLTKGISYKALFDDVSGLEIIGTSRNRYTAVTGLYELHFHTFSSNNVYLIAGAGGHIGLVNPETNRSFWVLGVDGIIGVEYSFDRAPFAVTLDVKPALNLVGRKTLDIGWFGVTGRFTF
ncbi:MAG: hypothetical protein AB8F95_01130 [Bacteroidia bacterium]